MFLLSLSKWHHAKIKATAKKAERTFLHSFKSFRGLNPNLKLSPGLFPALHWMHFLISCPWNFGGQQKRYCIYCAFYPSLSQTSHFSVQNFNKMLCLKMSFHFDNVRNSVSSNWLLEAFPGHYVWRGGQPTLIRRSSFRAGFILGWR